MKWIEQGKENNCGQIAVAVIAGVTVEDVVRIIGHNRGTKTGILRFALNQWGYRIPERALPMKTPPPLAIGQLHDTLGTRRGWHWVVVDGDKIYDGVWGTPDGQVLWPEGYRITSYLPVTRTRTVKYRTPHARA